MPTALGHWPRGPRVTRDMQISNLKMLRARKVGQLRAYEQAMFLLGRELGKEERELAIIEEDIETLTNEGYTISAVSSTV